MARCPPRREGHYGLLVTDCPGCRAVYPAEPRERHTPTLRAAVSLAGRLAAVLIGGAIIAVVTIIHDQDLETFSLSGRAFARGSAYPFLRSNFNAYLASINREPSFGLVGPALRAGGVLLAVGICLMMRGPYLRSLLTMMALTIAMAWMGAAMVAMEPMGPRNVMWVWDRTGAAIAIAMTFVLAVPGVVLANQSRMMHERASRLRLIRAIGKARIRRRNA